MIQHCEKQLAVSQKAKHIITPYDLAILLIGIHPKELKAGTQNRYVSVHCSIIIHKNQKVETTQISVNS